MSHRKKNAVETKRPVSLFRAWEPCVPSEVNNRYNGRKKSEVMSAVVVVLDLSRWRGKHRENLIRNRQVKCVFCVFQHIQHSHQKTTELWIKNAIAACPLSAKRARHCVDWVTWVGPQQFKKLLPRRGHYIYHSWVFHFLISADCEKHTTKRALFRRAKLSWRCKLRRNRRNNCQR